MFQCKDCETHVSAYIDGELSANDVEQFELHIASCEACEALLRDERQVRVLVQRIEVEPPAAFGAAWRAALSAEASTARPRFSLRWGSPFARFGAVAAAVVVIAGAVLVYNNRAGDGGMMAYSAQAPADTYAQAESRALNGSAESEDIAEGDMAPMIASAPSTGGGEVTAGDALEKGEQSTAEEESFAMDALAFDAGIPAILLPAELEFKRLQAEDNGLGEAEIQLAQQEIDAYLNEAEDIIATGAYTITITLPAATGAEELLAQALALIDYTHVFSGEPLALDIALEELHVVAQCLLDCGVRYDVDYVPGGDCQVVFCIA